MTTESGRCAKCFQPLEAGARFCGRCGTEVAAQADEARFEPGAPAQIECPSCSHLNMPDARFCERCGTQLQSSAQARGWDQPAKPQNTGHVQQGQSEDPWATGPGYERSLREDEACPRCGNYRQPDDASCTNCGLPFVQMSATPGVPYTVAVHGKPAGFWARLVAWIVDSIVLYIVQLPISFALLGSTTISEDAETLEDLGASFFLAQLVFYLINLAYYAGSLSLFGTTIGKKIFNIYILDETGKRPLSFPRALVRELAKWISALTLLIGYVMAGLRQDKRALHDLIAGTFPTQVRNPKR